MKMCLYLCMTCNHKFEQVDVYKECPRCKSTNIVERYWEYIFGITEGRNYGKYEYKQPLSIKELIEISERFDESREFGLRGIEDLYGIRGNSGNIEWWFTVKRGSYERINWLSQEKAGEFISQAIIDKMIKEENG